MQDDIYGGTRRWEKLQKCKKRTWISKTINHIGKMVEKEKHEVLVEKWFNNKPNIDNGSKGDYIDT